MYIIITIIELISNLKHILLYYAELYDYNYHNNSDENDLIITEVFFKKNYFKVFFLIKLWFIIKIITNH